MIALVEFRDEDGRVLATVAGVGDQWVIDTADGRHTIVDTRVEALLAAAAMADTVRLDGGGSDADV